MPGMQGSVVTVMPSTQARPVGLTADKLLLSDEAGLAPGHRKLTVAGPVDDQELIAMLAKYKDALLAEDAERWQELDQRWRRMWRQLDVQVGEGGRGKGKHKDQTPGMCCLSRDADSRLLRRLKPTLHCASHAKLLHFALPTYHAVLQLLLVRQGERLCIHLPHCISAQCLPAAGHLPARIICSCTCFGMQRCLPNVVTMPQLLAPATHRRASGQTCYKNWRFQWALARQL